MQTLESGKKKSVTIERIFDAPKDLVFAMFTKTEHLKNWYGPSNWTIPVSKLDLREGGSWHYCMESPKKDKQMWGKFEFHEISPTDKLVYTECMSDAEGKTAEQMPKMHTTLTFETIGSKTKLTNEIRFATAQELEMSTKGGMTKGFEQAYDKLNRLLQNM